MTEGQKKWVIENLKAEQENLEKALDAVSRATNELILAKARLDVIQSILVEQ